MRFMMMAIREGYGSAAPDVAPCAEAVARMMEYNKLLLKAGVLLALDGLFPPSTGARISYMDGKPTVTDGPFAESKEVIATRGSKSARFTRCPTFPKVAEGFEQLTR
jgi:hypothetical protein